MHSAILHRSACLLLLLLVLLLLLLLPCLLPQPYKVARTASVDDAGAMPPPPRVELPGSHGANLAQLAEQQQQQQQQGTPRAADRGPEQHFAHEAVAAGLQQQQQQAMQVSDLMRLSTAETDRL
jgi:hypothetical protein